MYSGYKIDISLMLLLRFRVLIYFFSMVFGYSLSTSLDCLTASFVISTWEVDKNRTFIYLETSSHIGSHALHHSTKLSRCPARIFPTGFCISMHYEAFSV